MNFTLNNHHYGIIFGSDVINNGVYLELNELQGDKLIQMLFAFRSDADKQITIYVYQSRLPFNLLEYFTSEVKRILSDIET